MLLVYPVSWYELVMVLKAILLAPIRIGSLATLTDLVLTVREYEADIDVRHLVLDQ
jgi:hypothetical protein